MPVLKKTRKGTDATSREVIWYDENNRFTARHAKEYLGWTEVEEGHYLLRDRRGKKIRCVNNLTNRPFIVSNMEKAKQELAHRNWQLNGETFIIGDKGSVIDGQHTMIGLVLLVQQWEDDPGSLPHWGEEPYLCKLLVMGISEDDRVVNTINTGKPRSFSDVLFRSQYFEDLEPKERKTVSRITESAVRTLWDRTGVKEQPHSPQRTHTEMIDLLDRHPTLLHCVRSVWESDKEQGISKLGITAGIASGLMYLMGCGLTPPDEYFSGSPPSEQLCNLSLMTKAEEFWTMLSEGNKRFKPLMQSLAAHIIATDGGSRSGTIAIIVKAWHLFSEDKTLNVDDLQLSYTKAEDGELPQLADKPTCGGIDTAGIPDAIEIGVPTEAEQEREKQRIKERRAEEARTSTKGSKLRQDPDMRHDFSDEPQIGKAVWVCDKVNEHDCWKGRLESLTAEVATVKVANGFQGAGMVKTVKLCDCQLRTKQPLPRDAD
jgi:hypothetical protein